MPARSKQSRNVEEYKRFLRSLKLVGIALVRSHFHIERERYFEDPEEQIFVDLKCRVSELKGNHFEIEATIPVKSSTTKEAGGGSFELEAIYILHFHTRGKASEVFASRFADSEARLVVWPYCREYVSNMCGRAHVPPISLPMAINEDN